MMIDKILTCGIVTLLSINLGACGSIALSPTSQSTVPPTSTVVPTPMSTAAWVAVDAAHQRVVYGCYEAFSLGGFASLCDMKADKSDRRFLAHHLMSNVFLSNDGQWLIFAYMDKDVLGRLYRLHVGSPDLQVLTPDGKRFAGYTIEKQEDDWVYFKVWTSGDPYDPRSFSHYRVPLAGGSLEKLPTHVMQPLP
ncbi:MAG: hypothetical protein ABI947_21895 [Chloroflexota bacterium]